MLVIEGLQAFYGKVEAVKGIDLEVEEGTIVSLLGANGAGKSTTLRAITGTIKQRKGSIRFLGKELIGSSASQIVKDGISCVPEGRELFSKLTVTENLQMGAYTLKSGRLQEKLKYAYQMFPRIEERKNQLAGTLSGGEQQMVAIARALMSEPKLLLLDEPSLGLAPIVVNDVFEVCKKLREQGTTLLLVEQNANQALRFTDKAYVMETGKIILSGASAELMDNPDIKKAYLGG